MYDSKYDNEPCFDLIKKANDQIQEHISIGSSVLWEKTGAPL